MGRAFAHVRSDDCTHVGGGPAVVEISDVAFGRQTHHHFESLRLRRVEQPARRSGVSADRVDASRGHCRKVARDDFSTRELVTVFIGCEGPIRRAANVELLVPIEQELAAGMQTRAAVSTYRRFRPEGRDGTQRRRLRLTPKVN